MKVLHIISSLSTGGAERALYNVLLGGLASSNESIVISLRDSGSFGGKIRELGVPVYELGLKKGFDVVKSALLLREVVRKVSPDIIQGWMYHGNLAATLAAKFSLARSPYLLWNVRHSLHSVGAEKFMTRQVIRCNRWLSKKPDVILYNSGLSCRQHELFGFSSSASKVIPNGFDIEELQPCFKIGEAVRKDLRISSDVKVIGHVARYHPMKDHASFLRASVKVMSYREDVVCLMAGRNVNLDNPTLADIVPNSLVDRFYFVGERSDIPELMRSMDVLCLSSAWGEAFPNVLGEAMALGVPCVATDVGDSRDIVGETGMVVPPLDSEALSNALLTMLDNTIDQQALLSSAARARIEERYALPRVVEEYSRLYERLVSR
ncbi:glycosyl transferase family 1 [Halomonas sp. ND22Bw]|uniref:glycosyltransferase n=1 Tax=Halomonas sp. ND22Bw TaxID=2054178 RepID=UPI000D0B953B|nr:glycosyl transferase family 1 [Halomonas sp. ND22Bw]